MLVIVRRALASFDPVARALSETTRIPREALLALLLGGLAYLGFAVYMRGFRGALHHDLFAAAAISAVPIALAGIPIQARDLPRYLVVLMRGLTVVMTGYVATAYMNVVPGFLTAEQQAAHAFLAWFKYAAIACGIAAWFRPAAFAVVAAYVMVSKAHLVDVFAFGIAITDYIIVVEFGLFLSIALAGLGLLRLIDRQGGGAAAAQPLLAPDEVATFLQFAFFLAVAAHFSNYFWSGMEKVLLDGPPLSWVYDNKTHYLLLTTHLTGLLPLGFSERLVALAFQAYDQVYVLLNAITLLGQLAAVVALWRLRWVFWLTLFYDLTHIAIFLVSGIFFWKWIVLNTLIVVALSRMPRTELWPGLRVLCIGFVVLADLHFSVAHLGWFDTPSVNTSRFVAIDRDGREYAVPSNYFLAASVTIAQQRVSRGIADVLPAGGFGGAKTHAQMRAAEACSLAPKPLPERPDFGIIERFVRQHHAYILAHADAAGRYDYDLYPHHIWSNPVRYRPFQALDKRSIVAYRWVSEGVCVGLKDGAFEARQIASRSHLVPVDDLSTAPAGR